MAKIIVRVFRRYVQENCSENSNDAKNVMHLKQRQRDFSAIDFWRKKLLLLFKG